MVLRHSLTAVAVVEAGDRLGNLPRTQPGHRESTATADWAKMRPGSRSTNLTLLTDSGAADLIAAT